MIRVASALLVLWTVLMADVKVQRGETTIAAGTSSVTLTAGTDYTAPASTGVAFVRVTSSSAISVNNDGDTGDASASSVIPVWTDLTSSFDLKRGTSTSGSDDEVAVTWELIESTVTNANQFVVRDAQTINVPEGSDAASREQSGTAVSGISDDADVVVFLLGAKCEDWGSAIEGRVTTDWDSANDKPIVRRGDPTSPGLATSAIDVRVAVVEFTGANWVIQGPIEHAYVSAGTIETETITAVGALSRTFTHQQYRTENAGLDETGNESWLSATDTLSFQLQSGADVSGMFGVAWVIENTQTDGTPMSVQRSGQLSRGSGNGTPDTWTVAITAVSSLEEASMGGMSARSSGAGTAFVRAWANEVLSATDTVSLRRVDDGQTITYRLEVVEWPTAPSAGQTVTVGLATETDSALATGSAKQQSVGLASETDTGLAITAEKSLTVGLATEVETALAVSALKALGVGLAQESETALAVGTAKAKAVGQAVEADSSLAISIIKSLTAGLATEADSALAVSVAKLVSLGQATETDAALAVAIAKVLGVGQAIESDTALAVSLGGTVVSVGQANEADSALATSIAKSMDVGLASETDAALAIVPLKGYDVGQASETDIAQAVIAERIYALGLSTESEQAFAVSVAKSLGVGLASETDQALAVVHQALAVAAENAVHAEHRVSDVDSESRSSAVWAEHRVSDVDAE